MPDAALKALLADDEPTIRLSVGDALEDAGYEVVVVADGEAARRELQEHQFDVLVSDVRMPRVDGLTLFREAKAAQPQLEVVLMTAFASVEDAVQALKDGASDYLTKPFDVDELLVRLTRIAERKRLEKELERAREQLAGKDARSIVGESPVMRRMRERVTTIAESDANVLVVGESGTGKELVARALHDASPRSRKPFIAVNCAAFPETLLEAELFGHERGAFTGAVKRREGRFKAADGGTLFLDEVAEIPLPAQAKLLRVLQEGSFEPLGTNTTVHADVRVISATNRDLRQRVAAGAFREDLYYRLKVLDVVIPPLRERRGDLAVLVQHFLTRFGAEGATIAPEAWAALSSYPWPGNVRELEHAVQHAAVLSRGATIGLDHLPSDVTLGRAGPPAAGAPMTLAPLAAALSQFEREYLLRALIETSGKRTKAAELLGISRKNLWEKLKAHDITDSDIEE